MPKKGTDQAATSSQPITIQLPGIEDMDNGKDQQIDLLKEISKKLTTLINSVKEIKTSVHDIKEQTVPRTGDPERDSNGGQLGEALQQINTHLERFNLPIAERTNVQEPATTNILIEEEALRLKSRISNIWAKNLQARRLAFWQSYRNRNIANKYNEWLSLEKIILPQWLQMKMIPNEPENLTRRREKHVLDNMRTEIDLLQVRHENQEEKYRGIDDKMTEEINKITTGERRNTLLKLWDEDCQRNEDISKKRWENKNAAWFAKYEETFKKIHS